MFTFVIIDVRVDSEQLLYLLIKTIVNLRQKSITMYMGFFFQNVYMYFFNDTILGQDSHGFEYN